ITFSTNSAATRQNIDLALTASFPGLFTVATTADIHTFNITDTGVANTNLPGLSFAGTGTTAAIGNVITLTEGNGDEVQSLELSGANNGTFTLSLGGVLGTPAGITYAPARNEAQTLTLNATGVAGTPGAAVPGDGSADSTFKLRFNGTTGNKELTFLNVVSPAAPDVFQALQSIPELFDPTTNVANYDVTGNPGGPFTITFINGKGSHNSLLFIE